jgi:hypothetical protein
MIIGNPPWGLQYQADKASPRSIVLKDSYALFVLKAHELLARGGIACLLTSGSWLTTRSYAAFRKKLMNSGMTSIYVLPERIFPQSALTSPPTFVILRKNNVSQTVQFYDTTGSKYISAPQNPTWVLNREDLVQGLGSRIPLAGDMIPFLKFEKTSHEITPLCDGAISTFSIGSKRMTLMSEIVSAIVTGIKTYDNDTYLACRGESAYKKISEDEIYDRPLTVDQFNHGIDSRKPKYLPIAKGGKTRREDGLPKQYWSLNSFYIRWDRQAVQNYRKQQSLRNKEYYFKRGVGFSAAGRFSPTFRLIGDSLFDSDFPVIFLKKPIEEFVLGVLCSSVGQFLCKQVLNHTYHFKIVDAMDFPIVIPAKEEFERVKNIVVRIVNSLKKDPLFDYKEDFWVLDDIINDMYAISPVMQKSIRGWFLRRCPSLSVTEKLPQRDVWSTKAETTRKFSSSSFLTRVVERIDDPEALASEMVDDAASYGSTSLLGGCVISEDKRVLLVDLNSRLKSRWILLNRGDISVSDLGATTSEWQEVFSEPFWLKIALQSHQMNLELTDAHEYAIDHLGEYKYRTGLFRKMEEVVEGAFSEFQRRVSESSFTSVKASK